MKSWVRNAPVMDAHTVQSTLQNASTCIPSFSTRLSQPSQKTVSRFVPVSRRGVGSQCKQVNTDSGFCSKCRVPETDLHLSSLQLRM